MGRTVVLAMGHRWELDLERAILGPEVELVDGRGLDPGALSQIMHEARAVLLGSGARLDGGSIKELTGCRAIVRYGIGIDNIDAEAAARRGIMVANVPDYCISEVSDHTVALLLAVSRRLPQALAVARRGEWDVGFMAGTRRLSTQVAGVVGFGRIGQATVQKLKPFGLSLLVYDPLVDDETIRSAAARPVSLEELLAQSDYVILQCPLTEATRYLLNRERLARMKANSWIINTSRGGLIDARALLEALEKGWIAGAALDVLEDEPPEAGHPLLGHERILVTPHAAWYSEDAKITLREHAALQVKGVLAGETPAGCLVIDARNCVSQHQEKGGN